MLVILDMPFVQLLIASEISVVDFSAFGMSVIF